MPPSPSITTLSTGFPPPGLSKETEKDFADRPLFGTGKGDLVDEPSPRRQEGLETESLSSQVRVPLPSDLRRYTLLAVFVSAQFLDIFGASAAIVGLSQMAKSLNMTTAESIWVVNAYSLTLASSLLTGGRIADTKNPKVVFIVGFLALGLFSMGVGLSRDKNTLLVLRAFSGLGASLTIPAATNLIVHLFPEPDLQETAIAIFGGSGAVANILGLFIGGCLVSAGWPWIFYFTTIIATPLAIICIFLIPHPPRHLPETHAWSSEEKGGQTSSPARLPKLDLVGTFLLTAAIVLFIFGLTSSNVNGWRQPTTISTVIIGALLFPVFFYWESQIDPVDALLDPAVWSIPNFTLLSIFALSNTYWFFLSQVSFSDIFQGEFGVSGIMTGVRFLPSGIAGVIAMVVASKISFKRFSLRMRLVGGALFAAGGSIMFSFVRRDDQYFPLVFPGLIVGSSGNSISFVSAYVALLLSVPPRHSGVIGGLWNSVLQLGAAAFLSITSTIQVAFPDEPGQLTPSFDGYQYGFLFNVGVLCLEALLVFVFFRDPLDLARTASSHELEEGENSGETRDTLP
ncbi:major facilitator superfamily-domain-containing protein [Mrakia frigida]|uniref:major facilitator superfamily-domain-containing protein n=1 Tax=Mrakia frigida TaxID=29902 RepID=UPI003FCC1FBC